MATAPATLAHAGADDLAAPQLEASRESLLFEHFRVPYRTADGPSGAAGELGERHPLAAWPAIRVRGSSGGPRLLLHPPARPDDALRELWLGETPLFARVVGDDAMRALLGPSSEWRAETPLRDREGRHVASIWRDAAGDVLLPFDPDEVIRAFLSEAYHGAGGARAGAWARSAARRAYYRVRPVLPRAAQLALRRAYLPVQSRSRFPRWPLEPALQDFCERMLELVAGLAGGRLPYLAPWPAGHEWAVGLSPHVETADGLTRLPALRAVEERAGCRSSWNLVPERYSTPDALVRELLDAGFEVGVHGLRHDGLDLESARRLRERLPGMWAHRDRWGASGFRAPALHRRWELMPELGFDYDSSYPDSDPYEPLPGGCCSWLPFFNEDLVELPVTLPQDHTLFALLGEQDERRWIEKADALRARGGMALIITHPDYVYEGPRLEAYERFLSAYAEDGTAWRPLPREVAAWWRRRAGSRPERAGRRWVVSGPAAGEAAVAFAEGPA